VEAVNALKSGFSDPGRSKLSCLSLLLYPILFYITITGRRKEALRKEGADNTTNKQLRKPIPLEDVG